MKKKVFGKKLSRERDTRLAVFRGLAKALILHGKIKTTKAKAKAVQPFIEKMVTTARQDSLSKKREVSRLLGNDRAFFKAFTAEAMKFSRKSGFTRIVPLPTRRGDMAEIVRLEWTDEIVTSVKKQVISKNKKEKEEKVKGKVLKKSAFKRSENKTSKNKK